jgi:hypothetical protein
VGIPDLIYTTDEEAADKIDEVLRNTERQEPLRTELVQSGKRFSVSAFTHGIQRIVGQFIEIKGRSSGLRLEGTVSS